ncbi:MAG: protein O-mannosyl-transferase family, partial [Planctomycetota bacterium]
MQKSPPRTVSAYVAVLLGAGALYAASCAPGALWQDSGLIQYRVWHGDVQGFLGLAISHPLYYILAIGAGYLPFGEFGHRVNLLSAVTGAIAVANLYLLVRLWSGRNFPALIAAVTLAVSHTFWRHASIAETYTLWTALFLGELVVLLQYSKTKRTGYLYALGLLNGLAVAVHMLASIPLACYLVLLLVLLARKAIRPRDAGLVALLWVAGALPFEYLIVRQMIDSGDVLGTLASAAFGDRWRSDVLNTTLSWQIVRENVLYFLLNFPTPNLLLFFAGGLALLRTGSTLLFRNLIVVLTLLFFAFAFRYTVSDRYAFFIPFYALVSSAVGMGAHAVQQRIRHRVILVAMAGSALLPVAVYAAAPRLAARTDMAIGTRADLGYRDDYTFFLRPWKTGYRGAERYAFEVLESAAPDAVIYADTTTIAPLLYVQEVKGKRPDVKIVTGIVRSAGAPPCTEEAFQKCIDAYPVYVTSDQPGYAPAFVLNKYDLLKSGL